MTGTPFLFMQLLLRIIFLVLAISTALRIVNSLARFFSKLNAGNPAPTSKPQSDPPGTTVLQQDPVCGTYISAGSSLKRIVNGKVFHFCSETCRDKYTG